MDPTHAFHPRVIDKKRKYSPKTFNLRIFFLWRLGNWQLGTKQIESTIHISHSCSLSVTCSFFVFCKISPSKHKTDNVLVTEYIIKKKNYITVACGSSVVVRVSNKNQWSRVWFLTGQNFVNQIFLFLI